MSGITVLVLLLLVICLPCSVSAQWRYVPEEDTLPRYPFIIRVISTQIVQSGRALNSGYVFHIGKRIYTGISYSDKTTSKDNKSSNLEYLHFGISLFALPYYDKTILTALQLTYGPALGYNSNDTGDDQRFIEPGLVFGSYLYYRATSKIAFGIDATYLSCKSKSIFVFRIGMMLNDNISLSYPGCLD